VTSFSKFAVSVSLFISCGAKRLIPVLMCPDARIGTVFVVILIVFIYWEDLIASQSSKVLEVPGKKDRSTQRG